LERRETRLLEEASCRRTGGEGGISVRRRNQAGLGVVLAVLSLAGCGRPASPAENVWAVVNGKEIKRDDVEKLYRNVVQTNAPAPSHEEALSLKLNILDELINNEILLERAQRLALEATDGEVEDKFTERKSPFTEEEFQRQLKERGMTVDDVKRELRRQLSIQKLMNREVAAKVSITDQDVSDFYNQNRAQFNVTEAQYRVAQIVVTPQRDPQLRNRKNDDAATDADARRKAALMLERINAGADFSQLASDYSEDPGTVSTGGDLGYIPESSLNQAPPELKKAVLGLKAGEISGVVAIGGRYHVLKLISRELPGQRELSDPQVQQVIREGLRNRKEQLLRAAYLTVARNESNVVNHLARQVLESVGKLPASGPPAASGTSQPAKQ
jgi:peptidyl-prolyl cis-trans isomerase SurA